MMMVRLSHCYFPTLLSKRSNVFQKGGGQLPRILVCKEEALAKRKVGNLALDVGGGKLGGWLVWQGAKCWG